MGEKPWVMPALADGSLPRTQQRVTHPDLGPATLQWCAPVEVKGEPPEWWVVLSPDSGQPGRRVRVVEVHPL